MKLKGMKNYSSEIVTVAGTQTETKDFTLATDKVACKIVIPTKVNGVEGKEACDLSIQSLSFHKQMYQPTEITAELSVALATSKSTDEVGIGRQTLVELFENLKVSLEEGSFSIGDDFYVHEVVPYYKKDSIRVVLKIYSLDKLLTLQKASRTPGVDAAQSVPALPGKNRHRPLWLSEAGQEHRWRFLQLLYTRRETLLLHWRCKRQRHTSRTNHDMDKRLVPPHVHQ